ncbi:hypothetical protein VNI00_008352 [Paramarasmius palmivorus]|uniref:RNA-dependent RNA polymerase n=1 Tax=Paramarasmius palmivorus TaxID=297713 RepID=A0AAW0D0R1_9AGAR
MSTSYQSISSAQGKARGSPSRATQGRLDNIRSGLISAVIASAMTEDETDSEFEAPQAGARRGQSLSTARKNQPRRGTSQQIRTISDSDSDVHMHFASDSSTETSISDSDTNAPKIPPAVKRIARAFSATSLRSSARMRSQVGDSTRDITTSLERASLTAGPSDSSSSVRPIQVSRLPVSPDKGKARDNFNKTASLLEHIFRDIHLESHVIEHDAELQAIYDDPRASVGWGTAFVLAQGLQSGQWTVQAIKERIDQLRGPDGKKMHLVPWIMRDHEPPKKLDNSIGYFHFFHPAKRALIEIYITSAELDREQRAILENRGRGLGLMGHWEGIENWFGGRVQFTAKVLIRVDKYKKRTYHIVLGGVEMTRSNRFTRLLGSRRYIQIKVGNVASSDAEAIASLLSHKLILNGRVFIPIPPKDGTVYAVETNEDYQRQPAAELGDHLRWTFGQVLHWHNPIEPNQDQPLSKYLSRIALGLSTSVPAIEFAPRNILPLDDEVTGDCPTGKPPAEKILTDGCGFINHAALCQIAKNLGYKNIPAAIQGRVAGAKGVWALHPNDHDDEPKIWIRPSQRKINYEPGKLHRAHCILDLLCASQPGKPPNLSEQAVINLWSNGVPEQVFKDLMKSGMEEITKPLTSWVRQPLEHAALWDAVARTSSAVSGRLARLGSNKSRALGLTGQEFEDDTGVEVERESNGVFIKAEPAITDASRDPISGQPATTGEIALEMLENGWHPSDEPYLAEKIKKVLTMALEDVVEECHFPLPEGTAFKCLAIADPLGVLAPDEVYYRSSKGFTDPETGITTLNATGEGLVGRYPLRLPSDIQKIKVVDKPELARWQDVLVVPTKPRMDRHKGLISFMSFLGGGDLDGDTVFLILMKEIVEAFCSRPLTVPDEDIEGQNFEKNIQRVTDLVECLRATDIAEAQRTFQSASLTSFRDGTFGRYSDFHNLAVEKFGLGHPTAVRLGFNILLDGAKTGLRLKRDVLAQDVGADVKHRLESTSDTFILHILLGFGKSLMDQYLGGYDQLAVNQRGSNRRDVDIIRSLTKAEHLATTDVPGRPDTAKFFKEELRLIREHVDGKVMASYRTACKSIDRPQDQVISEYSVRPKKKRKRESGASNLWREVSVAFAENVSGVAWLDEDRVKAAYAYKQNQKFAFLVAHRILNQMKAEACPDIVNTVNNLKGMNNAARKLFGIF